MLRRFQLQIGVKTVAIAINTSSRTRARASLTPDAPMPIMPRRFPAKRLPNIHVGDQLLKLPGLRMRRSPSTIRRGTARISAITISRVFGQYAGRVGYGNAASMRSVDINIVCTIAEIRNQFQPFTRGFISSPSITSATVGTRTSWSAINSPSSCATEPHLFD